MTNVNFEKKNVNTGYTFYFIEFEANFFRMNFYWQQLGNVLKL